jgi:hypothetical protein
MGVSSGWKLTPLWVLKLAILCCALLSASTPLQAQDAKPNILMILDSSRSMWGQIDGINKVVSARTVIGEVAPRLEQDANFGLVAYGHRQTAGCRDVQLVLPLGANKAEKIKSVVGGIKPKGSTPIATAMTEGAKAAGASKQKASIILIFDGLDNCKGDPCATAAKLKKSSKDLTIHAIAFDRKEKAALEALRCVADNTGGTFFSATNEGEFRIALDRVIEIALGQSELPVPIAAAPALEALAPAQPQTSGVVPQLQGALKFKQGPSDPNQTAALPPAIQPQQGPAAPLGLPPGAPAQAKPDDAKTAALASQPVAINFKALLTETGPEVRDGLVWRIYKPKPGRDGRYKLISTHRDAAPTADLRPGDYLVNAAYGLSNLTKKVTVTPGQSTGETLVLNAGGLRLGSILANGAKLAPNAVRYDVFADEADQFGNRQKVMGEAKPGVIIRLNAGVYHIVSVYGDANAVVRADVTVEPGKLTDATINHSAARVSFKLVLRRGGEAQADTRWNILTPGGDIVKESAGALPTHILAAGRYTVLARHKGKDYSQDFLINTGEVKQIEVVIR